MLNDITALVQVVLIDLALAGDNAVAVGLAASALPDNQRRRAIAAGIGLALALRVGFALVTVQLLRIQGLLLVGGVLLFWVAWRMWSDLREQHAAHAAAQAGDAAALGAAKPASFLRALLSIVVADVTMSLDNVIAVAGVARHAPEVMAFGLVLSVLLMGVAASLIARMIERYRWIAYVGLVVILLAAVRMVWEDGHNFAPTIIPALPVWFGAHPPIV